MDDLNVWGVFGSALGLLLAVAVAYHLSLPPNRHPANDKKQWILHLTYWAVAGVSFAIPTSVSAYIFSDLSITLIGTVFPIYESLRAICTPDEDDDKFWLQYFLVGGILFFSTQCVDEWLEGDGVVYWHQAMFFIYLWLFFPKTDGAAVIYNCFTQPYISPHVRKLTSKVNNWISFVYQGTVNAVHIALVVLVFMFFPDSLKKIIAIAIGTVYPLMSSIVAASTEDVEDDTYWLTYWACYSCLFLIMEFLENWLGWIPGFYTAYIAATLYLMLPMMQGADKVFRKVLVPLAGLQDLLILRDAIQIKKRIFSELDEEQAQAVRRAIVQFYDDENYNNAKSLDPGILKRDLVSSWKSVQLPGFKNPFRKRARQVDKQEDLLAKDNEGSATNSVELGQVDGKDHSGGNDYEPASITKY